MNGSINSTFNSTPNSSLFNDTEGSASIDFFLYVQLTVIAPTAIQSILCGIALIAIARIPALRTGENLFMTNLIIADVIRTFVGIWLAVYSIGTIESDAEEAHHGRACIAFLFLWHFQIFWSMWGTVLISFSRYLTIARPFRPSITTRKAALAIASTLTVGIVVASLPFYTWAKYRLRYISSEYYYRCSIDYDGTSKYITFYIFFFASSYAIPLALVTTLLVMTLHKIVQQTIQRRKLRSGVVDSGNGGNSTEKLQSPVMANSKAFWYVIAVVSTNVILPAPYIIGRLLYHQRLEMEALFSVGSIIMRIDFVINSILYVFWVKTFSRSLLDIIRCRKIRSSAVRM